MLKRVLPSIALLMVFTLSATAADKDAWYAKAVKSVSAKIEPAEAKPGQTVTLEFTPTAKGTFEYVCTIPGHKEAGMKGTITVN